MTSVNGEWASPITLIRGGLWTETLDIQNDDGTPASLENIVVRVRISRSVGHPAYVEGRSDVRGSGVEIMDQDIEENAGKVIVAIPLSDVPPGVCVGDIALIGEDDRPFAYVRGLMTVIPPLPEVSA